MCRSEADETRMVFDERKYTSILGLRMRLVKVYKLANAADKERWKQWIDA